MVFKILGVLGALIGFFLSDSFWGGVVGWILGGWVASLLDSRIEVKTKRYSRDEFIDSLLILSVAVAKADGQFTRSELYYIRDFMLRNFGPDTTNDALYRLQEISKQNYDIRTVCETMKSSSTIHERLLVLQFLFGISAADGVMDPLEIQEIERIAQQLGISRGDYESMKYMFTQQQWYRSGGSSQGSGHGQSSSSGGGGTYTYRSHSLDNDYKILEIPSTATDDEVKKAYRTLAKKYHPDRVAHLGDDMRKAAEERFTKLGQAYDNIRKARGMK